MLVVAGVYVIGRLDSLDKNLQATRIELQLKCMLRR